METEIYHGKTSYLVNFDTVEFGKFLEQTAVSLIYGCNSYNAKENSYPVNSEIGKIHLKYTHYAPHGYINSLMTQANLIKAFVEYYAKSKTKPYLVDKDIALLLTNSLSSFQAYKNNIVLDEEKNHGKGFGSATGFCKADWSEYNKEFLTLWDN